MITRQWTSICGVLNGECGTRVRTCGLKQARSFNANITKHDRLHDCYKMHWLKEKLHDPTDGLKGCPRDKILLTDFSDDFIRLLCLF